MRIVLTTESYLPYLSGVTVAVDALARGLGARGHEVLVLAPRPSPGAEVTSVGSPGPDPRHAWLDSYELPWLVPPSYRMPWPNPFALREARAFKPDIVHAHSPFVSGVLARRLARAVDGPLVFSHHTRFADYAHYLGVLATPVARLTDAYLRTFWSGCAAVIAPSSDLAAEIGKRVPRVRIEVIPTGVDVEGIRALTPIDPRPAAGWEPDTVVVASLGRLAHEKSPGTVLDAFALAAGRAPRLRLVVIGGGPDEVEMRTRASEPALAGRVLFTGALKRPDALAHLRAADVFAFASRTETQGLVLAEALTAGLPAVAVDAPGVRDSVRDGIDGRVVGADPAASVPARMAEVIVDLALDDELRRSMARRASEDAERFDLGRRIDEVEDLYRSVRG
jgi:1,2-diacylglycerol 3-alpha-glucosyltransferase